MKIFPENFELIQLFESEPLLKDPGVPWCYNHLTFVTTRGSDRVEFEIQPGYGNVNVRWYRNHIELLNLNLEEVEGVKVETTKEKEILRLLFKQGAGLSDLVVQLKPYVSVFSI